MPSLDELSHTIVVLEKKQAYLQAKVGEMAQSNSNLRAQGRYKERLK